MADETVTTSAILPAAEKPVPTIPQIETATAAGTESGKAERTFTQAELEAHIKDRLAQAERKHKDASEKIAAQAAEQAAKEQGKWQELATAYEPKAKRADELERYIAETLDAELLNVPEKLKGLVPEGMDALGKLRWLQTAKAAGLFAPLQAPRTDAGSGNGQGGMVPPRGALSPDRKQELAARYGVRADLLPDTLGV
jgi:hypothetical protein